MRNAQTLPIIRLNFYRIDLSPVEVSQFLYTPIGEQLLRRLGELVQTEARLSGFYALLAALILAAEPDIANQTQYRPYLSAAFAQTISQAPLEITLVQSLPA